MCYSKIDEQKNNKLLTKKLIILLTIAGGVSVANIYYNQPLLAEIAKTFNSTSQAAGLISTFTQLGYALGIFLFVPLGDIKDKKKLILTLNMFVTVALLGLSFAQNLIWVYFFSFAVGATTVIPQIIIPLAAQLSKPEDRGKVIGTLVSGFLIGILLARTVAGYVGYLVGWRLMFGFAASLMIILSILLYFKLPITASPDNINYKDLLKSVLKISQKYNILKKASISAALMFGSFSAFWTTLTFLLESTPYSMNSNQIGLFGLLGVIGALGARTIGKLNDKKNSNKLMVKCIVLCIISYVILGIFSIKIIGIIIGILLLDFGFQGAQVSNQTIIYRLSDDERSRINAIYIVANFIGGAIGSFLGSLAWNLYNWHGVCIVGLTMFFIALLINIKNDC